MCLFVYESVCFCVLLHENERLRMWQSVFYVCVLVYACCEFGKEYVCAYSKIIILKHVFLVVYFQTFWFLLE